MMSLRMIAVMIFAAWCAVRAVLSHDRANNDQPMCNRSNLQACKVKTPMNKGQSLIQRKKEAARGFQPEAEFESAFQPGKSHKLTANCEPWALPWQNNLAFSHYHSAAISGQTKHIRLPHGYMAEMTGWEAEHSGWSGFHGLFTDSALATPEALVSKLLPSRWYKYRVYLMNTRANITVKGVDADGFLSSGTTLAGHDFGEHGGLNMDQPVSLEGAIRARSDGTILFKFTPVQQQGHARTRICLFALHLAACLPADQKLPPLPKAKGIIGGGTANGHAGSVDMADYHLADTLTKVLYPETECSKSYFDVHGNKMQGCVENVNECASLALNDWECVSLVNYYGWEKPFGDYPGRCSCALRSVQPKTCGSYATGAQDPTGLGWYSRGGIIGHVYAVEAWWFPNDGIYDSTAALAESLWTCGGETIGDCHKKDTDPPDTEYVWQYGAGITGMAPYCECVKRTIPHPATPVPVIKEPCSSHLTAEECPYYCQWYSACTGDFPSDGAAPCESKCKRNKIAWTKKCGWIKCKGCADCQFPADDDDDDDDGAGAAPCEPHCERNKNEWAKKCGWNKCKGCDACQVDADEDTCIASSSKGLAYFSAGSSEWDGLDMNGQSRTKEEDATACQARCAAVADCKYFSFWVDGGCHLQDATAILRQSPDGSPETQYGEATCPKADAAGDDVVDASAAPCPSFCEKDKGKKCGWKVCKDCAFCQVSLRAKLMEEMVQLDKAPPGYTALSGDCGGNDLQVNQCWPPGCMSPEACAQTCDAKWDCRGFTMLDMLHADGPNLCILKYSSCSHTPKGPCTSGACFWERDAPPQPYKPEVMILDPPSAHALANFQDMLVSLVDGNLPDVSDSLITALGDSYSSWYKLLVDKASAECEDCEIPSMTKMNSPNYPSDDSFIELCVCGKGNVISYIANGLSRPWSCNERCDGVAVRGQILSQNSKDLDDASSTSECFVASDEGLELPPHCWAKVKSMGGATAVLPPGKYSKADLSNRGALKSDADEIVSVTRVSNQPPDCTEEVLLRLMMVEHMEPGLDDSDMTEAQKLLFGDATRYGGFSKFRFGKMAPRMIRWVFHDSGDFNNLEGMNGEHVSNGFTGLDGCLHTFRDHTGAEGSWKKTAFVMREDNDESGAAGYDPKIEMPDMNIDHNKHIADDPNIEIFLRLHSLNDYSKEKDLRVHGSSGQTFFEESVDCINTPGWTTGIHKMDFDHCAWVLSHDKCNEGASLNNPEVHCCQCGGGLNRSSIAPVLPRLTRPDALTLGANVAMEAMFGLNEPLGMQYGRWYSDDCAGPRPQIGSRNDWQIFSRRRYHSGGRPGLVIGIESGKEYSRVMKVPFALHDHHKDAWCPASNSLPSVKSNMKLTESEAVALFGAHSIGRVERIGFHKCNYLANMAFCPSMCPKISESKGLRYTHGWVWDDSPEILDNRYFANMMDSEFEDLPHCVSLGMSEEAATQGGGLGGPIPGIGGFHNHTKYGGRVCGGSCGEYDIGNVRFGVMGRGCAPQAWAPVVDPNLTYPCVAGYQATWEKTSPCAEDNCIYECVTSQTCSDALQDGSDSCKSCKNSCSNYWNKTGGRGSNAGDWNSATYNLLHAVSKDHPAQVANLRPLRWCRLSGFVHTKSWAHPPGVALNMEQFAMLHGNPTVVSVFPLDWSLLGTPMTKHHVKILGKDNAKFQSEFASAWKKVTSAGWNIHQSEKPSEGWSGGELSSCKKMPCTAKDGKFFCPIDVFNDRLRYLPKPASLRLELEECKGAAADGNDHPPDSAPGDCELVGGFGVRGTVQCGTKKYHCCTKRGCKWEKWLKRHRQADKSDEATCPFTKEDKKQEIDRTVAAWTAAAADLPAQTLPKSDDLGYDYGAATLASWNKGFEHEKLAKQWFFPRMVTDTLPAEVDMKSCPKLELSPFVVPTAMSKISVSYGDASGPAMQAHVNLLNTYKPL